MFHIVFNRLSAVSPGNGGIEFHFTLENRWPRRAKIISYEFQLWLLSSDHPGVERFLGLLLPDLRQDFAGELENQPQPLKLLWHCRSNEIHLIDEWRKGGNPRFELRAHMMVESAWTNPRPPTKPIECKWEQLIDSSQGPLIRIDVSAANWSEIVGKIHLPI